MGKDEGLSKGEEVTAVERLAEKITRKGAVVRLAGARVQIAPHLRRRKTGKIESVSAHKRKMELADLLPGPSGSGRAAGPGKPAPKADAPDAPSKPAAKGKEEAAPKPQGRPEGVASGSGTKEDPFVTDDVQVAARLIYEDQQTEEQESRYVKLDQPRQVSTLLDELKSMVDEAKAKGEKQTGFYDLCKVSVEGTNLFCAETKGIPRIKMPQLGGIPEAGSPADDEGRFPKDKKGEVNLAEAFVAYLRDEQGIDVEVRTVRADYLKATQNELNGGKVAGMANAIEAGNLDPEGEAIFVSNDDYVVDGHHRWAATVGVQLKGDEPLNLKTRRINTDIISILKLANDWTVQMGMAQKAA